MMVDVPKGTLRGRDALAQDSSMRLKIPLFALLSKAIVWNDRSATGFDAPVRLQRSSNDLPSYASTGFTEALGAPQTASSRVNLTSVPQVKVGFERSVKPAKVDPRSHPREGEVSPYYRRDRRDAHNPLPPDLPGLQALLQDRYHAVRQDRGSSTVAQMDSQLREGYGVVVFDAPPVWTTMVDDPPDWLLRKREAWLVRGQHERYGPTGHGYRQRGPIDPLFCDLELPEIHRLLARRTRLRASGQYEMADAVKLELSVHGIRVLDDSLEFSAAVASSLLTPPCPGREEGSNRIQYEEDETRPDDSDGVDAASRLRVQLLVRLRTEAHAIGDDATVSHLDLELFRSYGVRMDDIDRKWYFASGNDASDTRVDESLVRAIQRQHNQTESDECRANAFTLPLVTLSDVRQAESSTVPAYRLSSSSLTQLMPYFASRIVDLVRERSLKREEGKFLEADSLRRELWRTYVRVTMDSCLDNFQSRRCVS
jgi:hypothetical protein